MDFPDQSHVNRVRDALWRPQTSRATVMIGSGFSRNCDLKVPGVSRPPTWNGLKKAMRQKLYPANEETELKEPLDTDDALALAEQYEIAFGREELHRFLRQQIRDEQIEPGEMHRRILSLPWKDVFTTNWDTLLERTCEQVIPRAYSIVREVDEIPLTSTPRIVKLHGSLPANFPLIVTQEDYRQYPVRFAPFVNTAQQAMMETVFLLIGFSGNDPNFLHWSGWVRDNLGSSAPRIYTAGWLDLSVHERRVLESRNVIPIDLARHPKGSKWDEHNRHQIATDWILRSLEFGKPYPSEEWPKVFQRELQPTPNYMEPLDETPWISPSADETYPPNPESEDLNEAIAKQIASWVHNRTLYPDWLTIPVNRVARFALNTKRWAPVILNFIQSMEPCKRIEALRELIWRHEIAFTPIGPEVAKQANIELTSALNHPNTEDVLLQDLIGIALSLVAHARFNLDEEEFNEAISLVEKLSAGDPDTANRLRHEKCLWVLWDMDFDRLESELDAWNPETGDPFWVARKAALLLEIGHDEEADSLICSAVNTLRRGRNTSPTIPVFSRQAWTHYLFNKLQNASWDDADESYHGLMRDLRRFNCDPEDDVKHISRELMQPEESKRGPTFDVEHRRVKRTTFRTPEHYISSPEALRLDAARRAIRFGEVTALPPFVNSWSVPGYILESAARTLHAANELALALRMMLRVTNADGNDLLKTLLSRPKVATMPSDLAESTVDLCLRVIDFCLPKATRTGKSSAIHPHDRVRVAMESVSRLTLRLQPEKVGVVFIKALEYYRTPGIFDNLLDREAIWNLLKRSWEALPPIERTDFVFDVLNSPILGVDGFAAEPFRFIDPGQLIEQYDTRFPPRNDETESRWKDTVRFLIHSLEFGKEARSRAMLRLVKVVMKGVPTETEMSSIAQAIWDERTRVLHGLPGEDDIRQWVFLCMPEVESGSAMAWFRKSWLSVEDTSVINDVPTLESALFHLGDALNSARDQTFNFELSNAEETDVRELIRRWARVPVPSDFSLHLPRLDQTREGSINRAINGVTKLLLHIDIPTDLAEELLLKHRNLFDAELFAMPLLFALSKTLDAKTDEISAIFRQGLSSENESLVYSTTHAIEAWLLFAGLHAIERPPTELIQEIGLTIATRRRPAVRAALQTTRWIYEHGEQADRELLRKFVVEGLGFLIHELDYSNIEFEEIDSVPDMRWNCVAIAGAMQNIGYDDPIIKDWIDIAKEDPLPEVRYAVSDVEI